MQGSHIISSYINYFRNNFTFPTFTSFQLQQTAVWFFPQQAASQPQDGFTFTQHGALQQSLFTCFLQQSDPQQDFAGAQQQAAPSVQHTDGFLFWQQEQSQHAFSEKCMYY